MEKVEALADSLYPGMPMHTVERMHRRLPGVELHLSATLKQAMRQLHAAAGAVETRVVGAGPDEIAPESHIV